MMRRYNDLCNKSIRAVDGEIGTVRDFYFHDRSWDIRYVVVELDKWLKSRSVLISPVALTEFDGTCLMANLTKEEIADSPDSATDIPVYQQQISHAEALYAQAQPYACADDAPSHWLTYPLVRPLVESNLSKEGQWNRHLRSIQTVAHYALFGEDGYAGVAKDMLIDDRLWAIKYVVFSPGDCSDDSLLLLETTMVDSIEWGIESMRAPCPQASLQRCLRFDPQRHVNVSGGDLLEHVRTYANH